MSIPEGLRDVIGKRLSSLSEECNQILPIASVMDREFCLDTLREIAGADMEEDVSNAVLFLATDESHNIDGLVIYVDSGHPGKILILAT